MIALDTNHIRRLHPDWEVVTALCEEVDKLRADYRDPARVLADAGLLKVGEQ